jgi:hypothetical protein
MALLPIREARLGATDLAGDLLLPQAPVETDPPEVLAEGPGVCGNSRPAFLSSEEDMATYP